MPTTTETARPVVVGAPSRRDLPERMDTALGKSVQRVDGVAKVTGQALYNTDISVPNMLYGKILFSDRPHARIVRIDAGRALELPGVRAVVTAADAPVVRTGLYIRDKLTFAREKVRFVGEPMAAVAATSERLAAEAVKLIRVEYEDLPAVLDAEQATKEGAPLVHPEQSSYWTLSPYVRHGNVCMEARLSQGDVDRAFAEADFVFEDTYTTQPQHQVSIGPFACLASFGPDGRLTVWTATQQLSLCHWEVAFSLNMPMTKVRVIPLMLGGGFGAKVKSQYEPVCALLAKAARAPVRLTLTREEEFFTAPPAAPFRIHLKSGVNKDGTLVAREADILTDTGAYADHALGTAAHSLSAIQGTYRIPNCRGRSRAVYTNNINFGCLRGYGITQVLFAVEAQMDTMARALGLDPADFRLQNLCADGEEIITTEKLHSVHIRETMNMALAASDYRRKKGRLGPNRGIGLANLVKSTGFLPSAAVVRLNEDATVSILTAVTDIGTGTHTALCQIAAEAFDIPVERVSIAAQDSDTAPYDSGSIGSRTIYDSGNAVRLAAEDVKRQMAEAAAAALGCAPEAIVICGGRVFNGHKLDDGFTFADLLGISMYAGRGPLIGRSAHLSSRPPKQYPGEGFFDGPYATFAFGTHVAEVEVDPDTGRVVVSRFTAIHDVGRVINPDGIAGQVQGGVAQGIAFSLFEEMILQEGKVMNPHLADYRVPTALDVPEVTMGFVEEPDPTGPFGAKGIGEYPILGPAPAIANAILDATGVSLKDLPISPERLYFALHPEDR